MNFPRAAQPQCPRAASVAGVATVGDRKAGSPCHHFNAALALRQLLQNFQPMRVGERFGDRRELGEQRRFWVRS
jgi:hypothetical protein